MGPISPSNIQLGMIGCGWFQLHGQTNKEQRIIMFPLFVFLHLSVVLLDSPDSKRCSIAH